MVQGESLSLIMINMKWTSLLPTALLLVPAALVLGELPGVNYTIRTMNMAPTNTPEGNPTVVAMRLIEKTGDEGFPMNSAWEKAPAIQFNHDWKGENPDPQRATEVRLLWNPDTLFVRFHCTYRSITVFPDARADGWRYELWDRDVAETFLQPDSSDLFVYREFEVSPNGFWIDLAVSHGKIEELHSGLRRRVVLDERAKTWTAQMALPMKCLTTQFDPKHAWRANFFRIEGAGDSRFYSAWSPTHTPKASFHVPSAFGSLLFRE